MPSGLAGRRQTHPCKANHAVLRKGNDIILVDTGSGTKLQPTAGKLLENLKAAGIDPATVTKVILTHGHPDHVWGTTDASGAFYFPNAAYHVGAAEWNFWTDPDLLGKMPAEMGDFVKGAQREFAAVKDKVTMIKPGDDVVSGVRALDTAGHTPGHLSFEVAGGEGLIITADAALNEVIFFEHPEWKFAFDSIPDLAIQNRKALIDRAATDKIKLLGYHWASPGVGFAERKDSAYRLRRGELTYPCFHQKGAALPRLPRFRGSISVSGRDPGEFMTERPQFLPRVGS